MKKLSNTLLWLGGIFSLFNLGFFLLMRSIWIFVDNTVSLPPNIPISFTQLFVGILILFSLLFILVLIIKAYTDKFLSTAAVKFMILIILFLEFIFLGLNIYLYMQMGNTKTEVWRRLVLSLPYLGVTLLLLYLTLIHPQTKFSKSKLFRTIMVLSVIVVSLLMIFDPRQVRITSAPILQAYDRDTVAIIWSTNFNSTGEVSYGSDAEHMKTAVETEDGLIKANTKLHKVRIPIKDMNEMVYQVSSTKINNFYDCHVEYGNTVKSPVFSYTPIDDDDELTFYILNDVHSNAQVYKEFLTDNDYDFVVTNGDAVEMAESYDEIKKDFLWPIGKNTESSKLYYFVRGNHETRGQEARDFKEYLTLPENRYYYTFQTGPVYAIVMDSGEDKLDDHEEYSGLVDFENYKKEETKWLDEVLQSDEYQAARYHVVFIHSPLNSYMDQQEDNYLKTYEALWRSKLSDAGIDVVFSGHTHIPQLITPAVGNATFPTVIAGGDAWIVKDYLAIRTEITEQQMIIYYENIDGVKEEVLRIAPKE